jgi:hypothetical protein
MLCFSVALAQHAPASQAPPLDELCFLITTPDLEQTGHVSSDYDVVKRGLAVHFADRLSAYLPTHKSFVLRTYETTDSEKLRTLETKVLEIIPKAKINRMTFQQMQQLKN